MKKYLGFVVIVSGLLFIGCTTEPSFNPNSKRIEFINGKPYRLPYNVGRHPGTITNSAKDKERIAIDRKYGLNCKYGDVRWLELSSYKELDKIKVAKITEAEKKKQKDLLFQELIRSGKYGCSSPLSNQEYNFYHNQEIQDAADRRASANRAAAYSAAAANARAASQNLQAAQTAKKVNVNVSGNVNHNVQHSGSVNVNHSYTPMYY